MKAQKLIKKTYLRKRILAAVLVVALTGVNFYSIKADTIGDASAKKNEAEEELNELSGQIDEIMSIQSELQEEMNAYDEELMYLLTDMDLLAEDMSNKQIEIDQANEDLAAAQEQERTQYEAMKTRIQYMYENGNGNVWTAIMGASSITDLLNRVEYVSEVYDYDRNQLNVYQETVQQVADLTEQLALEMAEMEDIEISYKEQEASLEALIAERQSEMENFDTQLASARNLASQYAETIKQQNQIIAAEQARIAAEQARLAAEAEAARRAQEAASSSSTSGSQGNSSSTGLTDQGLNPPYTTGVSGGDVVAYASQFVGNPYVYGGNSLTEGCDCSYFVMACFSYYGISVPRSSYALKSCGQAVSYDCAQPGDIVCYSGHVAIYIGNGRIVHASSPKNGICYSNATYRTILTIRRVL